MSEKIDTKLCDAHFSTADKALLLNIIENYIAIIKNKKTDAKWAKQRTMHGVK